MEKKLTCEINHTIQYNSDEVPDCMSGHSANVINNTLYIFGGYNGDERFSKLWQIQNVSTIRTNGDELKWEQGMKSTSVTYRLTLSVPLQSARPITGRAGHICHAVTFPNSLSPQLFVHGGYDSDRRVLSDSCRIDPTTRQCHQLTPTVNDKFVLDRRWHVSWATQDRVFIHGGWNDAGPLDSVGYYTVASNTWQALVTTGDRPSPRRWHAATLLPNKASVLTCGGYDGGPLADLHRLDLERGVWTSCKLKTKMAPRCRHSLVMLPHRPKEVFIIGGFSGQAAANPSVETAVLTLDDMNVSQAPIENYFDLIRAGQSATVLPDCNSCILFGGINSQGQTTNDVMEFHD